MRLTARRLIRSPRLSTSWSTRLTSWPFRNPALERIQRAGRGFVQQPRRATGARTASSASRRERERRGGRSRAGSRLDLVHCGSRKVGGRDACSRAEARVSVTRLTSADRHTSVNQSYVPPCAWQRCPCSAPRMCHWRSAIGTVCSCARSSLRPAGSKRLVVPHGGSESNFPERARAGAIPGSAPVATTARSTPWALMWVSAPA
jgi:hypothetical protein